MGDQVRENLNDNVSFLSFESLQNYGNNSIIATLLPAKNIFFEFFPQKNNFQCNQLKYPFPCLTISGSDDVQSTMVEGSVSPSSPSRNRSTMLSYASAINPGSRA